MPITAAFLISVATGFGESSDLLDLAWSIIIVETAR